MSGTRVWVTCLGHVSGTWHAGSVRFRDEASRQALTSLCTAALFSGLGPLGPSWNEDVEMETRGIVVREGAGGPRIAELEVAERACERLCSGLAREGAGWILGLKPETPLGHLYPRAAWGRGEDRWPLQTRGRGHSQHRESLPPLQLCYRGGPFSWVTWNPHPIPPLVAGCHLGRAGAQVLEASVSPAVGADAYLPPRGLSRCRAAPEHELPPLLRPLLEQRLLVRLPQHQPLGLQEAEESLVSPDRGEAGIGLPSWGPGGFRRFWVLRPPAPAGPGS